MSSNNASGSGGSSSTDRDEALARELQAEFQREVEQYASSMTWSEINNVFTPPPSHRRYASASSSAGVAGVDAPSARTNTTSSPPTSTAMPIVYGINEPTPHSKKSTAKKNNSSPDLTVSTQSSTPLSSPDISPIALFLESQSNRRTSSSNAIFIDGEEDDDANLARRLEQEMIDEEIASNLAHAERSFSLTRAEQASAAFATSGTTAPSSSILESRMESQDSFVETPLRRVCRRQQGGERNDCKSRFFFWGIRITSAVIVLGVSFMIFLTVFGKRASDSLDPATW